ncbi:MAG: succinyl-diaminopimelate desuccinylase [Gammaproteobacteria bacterium]|jgi:succinyl-diaminopimelate desuccinylase
MSENDSTLDLACELIARRSVTPDDAGCQDVLAERLDALGFTVEALPFGTVRNLWATRGNDGPLLVFAGHTDVVPPGPEDLWDTPPFEPVLADGVLHGRGAADMKGALAAMITACESLFSERPEFDGRLGFLITSDEEGDAVDGTRRVVETLLERGVKIDWCVVGEPSSRSAAGDVIRNGRRGSLNGRLVVHGVQGHVAYPDEAENPIHRLAPVLAELVSTQWDQGNADFPPTSFQVSNLHAGTGAGNVIPATVQVDFNFRYSPETSAIELRRHVETLLVSAGIPHELEWRESGRPFHTPRGRLLDAVDEAVLDVRGELPEHSTGGGTSDGRFIAPAGAQVVELGPVNALIHKVNERVAVRDLHDLQQMYRRVIERLFD